MSDAEIRTQQQLLLAYKSWTARQNPQPEDCVEIEWRLGTFHQNKFQPGVPRNDWIRIASALNLLEWNEHRDHLTADNVRLRVTYSIQSKTRTVECVQKQALCLPEYVSRYCRLAANVEREVAVDSLPAMPAVRHARIKHAASRSYHGQHVLQCNIAPEWRYDAAVVWEGPAMEMASQRQEHWLQAWEASPAHDTSTYEIELEWTNAGPIFATWQTMDGSMVQSDAMHVARSAVAKMAHLEQDIVWKE